MKVRSPLAILTALLLLALLLNASLAAAQEPPVTSAAPSDSEPADATLAASAISSGFSYQGRLKSGGSLVSGPCDLQFALFDSLAGGLQIGATESKPAVAVTNGLFTTVVNAGSQFGANAFQQARWLQVAVRCPAGDPGRLHDPHPAATVDRRALCPGAVAGTRILGDAYQNFKVQSNAPTGSVPAGVTGEMLTATDGVGVYGSNSVSTAGATGAGVWGRSWTPSGAGVRGTAVGSGSGVTGASDTGAGVRATSGGVGLGAPALFAEATSTDAVEPAGIAVYALNHGDDTTIVAHNTGTGDTFRSIDSGGHITYRVTSTGRVVVSAVQIYGGGDVAERFETSDDEAVEPGTLMVIDDAQPGKLKPSAGAYDTKVAGIVSGAGGVNPGVTLQQDGVMEGDAVIAIAGRVYVKAEAFSGAIAPGDLLTTSDIPGHAMKATDRQRAQGAVIGKAMTGLESGLGLVLVLVSLQ